MIKTLMKRLNNPDLLEYYVMALLAIGLPLVAYVYFDWKAALATFVISQSVIGLLALRSR